MCVVPVASDQSRRSFRDNIYDAIYYSIYFPWQYPIIERAEILAKLQYPYLKSAVLPL